MLNHPVLTAMLPVVLLIAIGFGVGRGGWVDGAAVKSLSNLVFLLLAPALLFRSMSSVRVQQMDFASVGVYFLAAALVFVGVLFFYGRGQRGAVLALAATFSNTIMIGIALIGLAYGEAGLVTQLALVSVHALILLTVTTLVLELARAREQMGAQAREQGGAVPMLASAWQAAKSAIIHPVPLPIICGLLYAQTGWPLPALVDQPLKLLGQAFAPLALLMVGITLATNPMGAHVRGAFVLALVKCVLHPLLVALLGWWLAVPPLPLTVMIVTASLPIGANVFLFAQRYNVAQERVTAAVAMSTLVALLSTTLAMLLTRYWLGF
jgi:malonate transporter and related proteins